MGVYSSKRWMLLYSWVWKSGQIWSRKAGSGSMCLYVKSKHLIRERSQTLLWDKRGSNWVTGHYMGGFKVICKPQGKPREMNELESQLKVETLKGLWIRRWSESPTNQKIRSDQIYVCVNMCGWSLLTKHGLVLCLADPSISVWMECQWCECEVCSVKHT